MIYAIIGVVTAIALFLILRDDHDDSYNKNEKSHGKIPKTKYQKKEKKLTSSSPSKGPTVSSQKKPPAVSSPKSSLLQQIASAVEDAVNEASATAGGTAGIFRETAADARKAIESTIREIRKGWADEKPDLSFLEKIDYSEDLEENTETFDIAGLYYHCTVRDCGKIVGVVRPEPSNTHDPRAQAVIRSDGKLLGYIPRTQLDWYEDFNEEDVECPFVGEIILDRAQARLTAEIKVIIPSSIEYVKEEIEAELQASLGDREGAP